jgi:hypothetical protein
MYMFRSKWHEYEYATFVIDNALAARPKENFPLHNIKNNKSNSVIFSLQTQHFVIK